MARRAIAAFLPLLVLVTACGGGDEPEVSTAVRPAPRPSSGAAPWRAPSDPLRRIRLAGLKPEYREFLSYHVHAHLDVFVNGKPEPVPAGIGIEIRDPGVRSAEDRAGLPVYGFIQRCVEPCISQLHTHDYTGVLHTESKRSRPNTLGEFFVEWGVRLDRSCVGGYCTPNAAVSIFVDGERETGDPTRIELTNGKEIAIVIGTPPASIPSEFPS